MMTMCTIPVDAAINKFSLFSNLGITCFWTGVGWLIFWLYKAVMISEDSPNL
jgi:hypothetical protein